MLTIYTDESRLVGKEIKRRIDSLFNGRITESDIDNTAAQLIKRIDGSEYKDGVVKTPVGNTVLQNLSTGCKAAILIYKFPDEIFSTRECGNNAILEIIQLHEGNVLIYDKPFNEIDPMLPVDCIVKPRDGLNYTCTCWPELWRYWEGGWPEDGIPDKR